MKTLRYVLSGLLVLVFAAALFAACGDDDDDDDDDDWNDPYPTDPDAFRLESSAFEHMGALPATYTCDNEDVDTGISPPLNWVNAPEGAAYFAVTTRDPDSGGGDTKHWALINIPGDYTSLDEGVSPTGTLPEGSWETLNYKNEPGYRGPCPPPDDSAHRYRFTLYALSEEVAAPGTDVTLDEALPWIEGAAIAQTTLTGVYDR